MEPFTVHTGTAVPLRRGNVDTDQIIPARYVPYFSGTGLGNALFADWRNDPHFVLNLPQYQGATILVAGSDFGTGSSREAAVWAIQQAGFRVVIAPRFGDIFRGNSLMRGLLTITLTVAVVEELWQLVEADPTLPISVDLERLEVRWVDRVEPFTLGQDARGRLISGIDPIAATLRHEGDIAAYERTRRPTLPRTAAV